MKPSRGDFGATPSGLHRGLVNVTKQTRRQWWAMFLTPAGVIAVAGLLIKSEACSPLKAFPWLTRQEAHELMQPIKDDVAELKQQVQTLPGDVVKALEQRESKRGRR